MDKIQIVIRKNKYGSWEAFFPDKSDIKGVQKKKEDAITALLQDNLGKVALVLSNCFEIIDENIK